MEDRYEIKGKIGQGGIGTVYRAYDIKMRRDVAIKRILTSPEDPTLKEEATKQMVAEASALASLQHPHIVTIFDVGSDEDGPFVVMELISGKTLDEIIENAPLTWEDFRQVAVQSQEALIAAQELDMIHSDLKPPNIMLTWLPSGKFQVKIVDFGLAVLAQSQSKEELETLESVFGSIFFMPPEQFEREPLDARSDLYSMGCVYYQALTGAYPFNGSSGTEVMTAHLHHVVTPIQDLRADIPLWVCDWVMWLINRYPHDRPESARDALTVFIQNDKHPNPEMSRGSAKSKRPRLIIPGAIPVATETTGGAPAPQSLEFARPGYEKPDAETSGNAGAPKTAPQALAPPDGFKPSVHTSTYANMEVDAPNKPLTGFVNPSTAPVKPMTGPVKVVAAPTAKLATTSSVQVSAPVTSQVQLTTAVPKKTVGLSNPLKVVVAILLGVLVVISGWALKNRSDQNKRNEIFNKILLSAMQDEVKEVYTNKEELEILLEAVANTGIVDQRPAIYTALSLAKANDGTDIDARIIEFATTRELLKDVRLKLIGDVLRLRNNPAVVSPLLTYAQTTDDMAAAVEALEAVRMMVKDDQADIFLEFIATTKRADIRKAAENNLIEIIKMSNNLRYLTKRISVLYGQADSNKDVRQTLLRLLGYCSNPEALGYVKEALAGTDMTDRIAALTALGAWSDSSAFAVIVDYIKGSNDVNTRLKAFDSAIQLLAQESTLKDSAKSNALWTQLSGLATIGSEKERVIRGLVNLDDEWVLSLLEGFKKDENSSISQLAAKGLDHVRERKKLNSKK